LPPPSPAYSAARMLAATFPPAANDIRYGRSKFCEARWKRGSAINKSHLAFPFLLIVLLSVLLVGYMGEADQANKREAVRSLVLDAAALIEDEGASAYPAFRQDGSEWLHGDTYVFVWRTDGMRLVYPPDPSGEGQNMSALVDAKGKSIGTLFINTALSGDGEGWVEYLWPRPGDAVPSAKQTYIKGVSTGGESLLVGSGLYAGSAEDAMRPLQYLAIIVESMIAAVGLLIAVRQKRFFGYGIFLTFAIYVFYDMARLIPLEVSDATLYPAFFVATISALWTVILIYRERQNQNQNQAHPASP